MLKGADGPRTRCHIVEKEQSKAKLLHLRLDGAHPRRISGMMRRMTTKQGKWKVHVVHHSPVGKSTRQRRLSAARRPSRPQPPRLRGPAVALQITVTQDYCAIEPLAEAA